MKGSNAIKTHISTEKVQHSFEKSAKERKASKNLYTLNKQSDDEGSNSSEDERIIEPQKGYTKYKNVSYQPESQSESENNQEDSKHQPKPKYNLKINEQSYKNHSQNQESQNQSDQDQTDQNEQRIKRYQHSKDPDNQSLKLHMTIKQLEQENELLKTSLTSHENRQKQMISKYAKLEANNKRYQYEIVKITNSEKEKKDQENLLKSTKLEIQTIKKSNEQILGFIESQNVRILSYIKVLISKLVNEGPIQAQNPAKTQNQSIAGYLEKCISTLKQNRKTIFKKFGLSDQISKENISNNIQAERELYTQSSQNFQFSYERQRIVELNKENSKLSAQIKLIKENFNKISDTYKKSITEKEHQFRQEKTQLCERYNNAIEHLKVKYKTLEGKIVEQEEKYELKVNEIQKALGQKEKVIKKLKEQLKQLNVKLDEIEEERFQLHNSALRQRQKGAYQSKKKFIDGDFLNESLNSNKQKSFNKDRSCYNDRSFHKDMKDHSHNQSFYEYQPERKRNKKMDQTEENIIIKKSHKNKKKNDQQPSISEEEHYIQKIDQQIEKLQREMLQDYEDLA